MAQLSLRKVEKTYPNGFKAVHGVDLEVRDGEFMVFVGPSGCAKSTLLRMIAGLESISGGELRIGDRVVNDPAAQAARHRDGVPELRAVPPHEGV
jgi:oligogalacturonide transport system ATP-binding protein